MADAGKFEGMKREEVQALAKKMGVNAGGKTEEIIARIQAAEVAQEGQETAAGQEQAAQGVQEGQETAAEKEQAEELVTVKIIEKFHDLKLNKIKEVGEAYQVKKERAAELVAAGVAEIQK